ncbi:MAG TPA: type 4 pilus major pilin [Alphaproteobacteria bacterium]
MKTTKHMARGFSLLELLLVVGVGAVLILAGLSAYRLVSEGNAATSGVRQLQTLKQQVQTAFQGQSNYGAAAADMRPTLNTLNLLPGDMTYSAGPPVNLNNAFSGNTLITVGAAPQTTFLIQMNNVPSSACNKLGQLFSTTSNSDFVSLKIGTASPPTVAIAQPPTVAGLAAATACGAAAQVNMLWEFR